MARLTVGGPGRPLTGTSHYDAGLVQNPSGLVPPYRKAVSLQGLGHPTTAIPLPRRGMDRLHAGPQRHLGTLYGWRSMALHVRVASPLRLTSNTSQQHGAWPRAVLLCHKGILHLSAFTKKRMAFFKLSRSIRHRLTSSRSWGSSSWAAGSRPLPGKAVWVLAVYACFHRRSLLTLIPKCRAVSATP
jgi:hypothetical protein